MPRVSLSYNIPIAFIGSCFAGAIANSHAFLSFRLSVSAVVGGLRVTSFCFDVLLFYNVFNHHSTVEELREPTFPALAVKPGGSGIFEDFGFEAGFELRSSTHCGGGGGKGAISCLVAIFADVDIYCKESKVLRLKLKFADESRGCGGHGGLCTARVQSTPWRAILTLKAILSPPIIHRQSKSNISNFSGLFSTLLICV